MSDQKTRNNHYVPRWYQRGFLAPDESQLFYLNLAPDQKSLPGGREVSRTALHKWGPANCFVEFDLYTTHFGPIVNDEVEKHLFGVIDDQGAKAVRALMAGEHAALHDSFQDLFEHLAAQKLRTPKGLDWIRSCYGDMSQVDLMVEMQALRLMHCTMWAEGVREIVSAEESDVKFIVTDHPVTVYNAAVDPTSGQCAYPQEPIAAALGTQTVFALDANRCLIFTHLEYAKQPNRKDLTRLRTNARHLGVGMTRTDNFIRDRRLNRDEIITINHLIKSRAKRYVAAGNKAWLYPEQHFKGSWSQIAQVLLPKDELWRFGGEIYVGYRDGTHGYWDEHGRTTKAHEYLNRKEPRKNIGANDFCGCGSAYAFKNCCQRLPVEERPPWKVYGLRERNMMFCNAVQHILGLHEETTWETVRRTLTDEHVKRIHEAFAGLWPEDTDLASLLPRPNPKVLRSVYLGFSDPRTVEAAVLGWLPYVDEIVMVNPFLIGPSLKSELSPIESPSGHKLQTLKNVVLLLKLAPFIRAGVVHLVPDPGEVNAPFGQHLRHVLERRTFGWTPPLGGLHRVFKLEEDEYQRFIRLLPEDSLRRHLAQQMPDMDAAMAEQVIAYLRRQAQADPYALLQELPVGKEGAQYQIVKGLSLESALYLASLTGSIIHVDTEAHWERLVKDAQPPDAPPHSTWEPVRQALSEISFPVELNARRVAERLASGDLPPIHSILRGVAEAVERPGSGVIPHDLAKLLRQARGKVERPWKPTGVGSVLHAKLEMHVPPAGFGRHEVQRLLVMFAGVTRPCRVALAIRLVFDGPAGNEEASNQDAEGFWR